jgi:hypothetical protein
MKVMRDSNGLSIRDGDKVAVQTAPDGPICQATVIQARGDRAEELDSVLVAFENETAQWMPSSALTVI